MGYITVVLFTVTTFLALIERYIRKYKLLLYFLISFALILIAGLRPVGIDRTQATTNIHISIMTHQMH